MNPEQLIRRSSDASLLVDLAHYQAALAEDRMPEMRPYWERTVAQLEYEIEQRALLASTAGHWIPQLITEVPF